MERIAVVGFDNLSNRSDLGWAGRAAATITVAGRSSGERLQAFYAPTLRDAQGRMPTRTIEGYLTESGGKLTLHGIIRDALSQRATAAWTIAANDIITLAAEIARQAGLPPAQYTTSNADAIKAHFQALSSTEPASAESGLREAIRLDPQYGAPYLALYDLLARTNRVAEARDLIGAATAARFTPVEKARVDAIQAKTPTEQVRALTTLARLQPGELDTLRQAAERALFAGLYKDAIAAIDQLLAVNPTEEAPLNMRGYAYTYLGDFEGASKAFAEYRANLPNSENAIDSSGEMMFYFRRYPEAAKFFLEAHAKNPGLLGGAEPFRAAYAQFLAGNLPEADRLFATFVRNTSDVRYAIWRRWTGRATGDAPAGLRALWALQDGDRKTAAELAQTARQQASNPALANLAGLASILSMPAASPDEWRARILRAVPRPEQQAGRDELLRWALYFDTHWRESAVLWKDAFVRAPGHANNEPRIMLAASLLAAGQQAEAKKTMPHGFLPPPNLSANLDVLLYPIAASTLKKL